MNIRDYNALGVNIKTTKEENNTNEFVVEMNQERWQAIEKCKENFLRDGISPYDCTYMYPEIADSWIRSKKYGVDPYAKNLGYSLKPKELSALIRDKHAMIEIASGFMQKHLGLLSSSGYLMCLTDENGILLVSAGEKNIVEQFERINASPGSVWSEETIGTNCHSLCIELKKPVQLIGPYYYSLIVYDNIGSGTPIMNENGDVMGVILVVQATVPEKQIKQPHLLGWVVSAGMAIESQLKLRKRSYYIGLANRTEKSTLKSIGEGCITVDNKGIITHINKEGAELFNMKEAAARDRHFSDLFGSELVIDKILADGQPIINQEISINNDTLGETYKLHLEPIFYEEADVPDSVLIRFSLTGRINKILTDSKEEMKDSFAPIRGESIVLKDTIDKAHRIAHHDGGVLLIGDSGTGKELFAHAIHEEYRPGGAFIAINCSSFPRNLIESELFGYEGGSFTGAERRGKMGKIELANGGTLFLDEIGDMPLELQPVLLRVLEDKKVMRIGGKEYISVDFRVIAATNQNLLELVKDNKFRKDLYYRLAVFKLDIPPLKDRQNDVLYLAQYFIEKYARQFDLKKLPVLNDDVAKVFMEYDWPGNVRQLDNTITYALAMMTDNVITLKQLPDELLQNIYDRPPYKGHNKKIPTGEEREVVGKIVLDANMPMQEIEKTAIEETLISTGYNIPDAAKILGMARSTLYRKLKEYEIKS